MYGKTMCTETGEPLPRTVDRGVSCVNGREGSKLTSNDNHINDIDDARVFESFEDLDFSEGSDRHSFLLVVHENPLQGDDLSCGFLDCLMYLAAKVVRGKCRVGVQLLPKCSFPQFGRNVIILN